MQDNLHRLLDILQMKCWHFTQQRPKKDELGSKMRKSLYCHLSCLFVNSDYTGYDEVSHLL